jgi:transposase
VICAFEATGNYHRPIAWRLIEAGFDVRLVSSMALARTREALHNGWDKNDPRDAQASFTCYGSARRNVTMTRSGPG